MGNYWLTIRERRDFLAELRTYFMIFTPTDGAPRPMWKDGQEPDFKPLYAKYPRVRLGIRFSINWLLKDHQRKTCHASN